MTPSAWILVAAIVGIGPVLGYAVRAIIRKRAKWYECVALALASYVVWWCWWDVHQHEQRLEYMRQWMRAHPGERTWFE